ncbi:MAG: DNA adenine methylase [Myxococcales bacterium]|nr:DNA adenine methylase [Myxococcales bacterium]
MKPPRAPKASEHLPCPVLKWAGGKRQLLPEILPRIERAGPVGAYHEPFIGGGAVFFELSRLGRLPGRATIADVNPNLIDVYLAVQSEVVALTALLADHQERHRVGRQEYYYAVRDAPGAATSPTQVERAARVVYLNKTCFNGLYRENSKGKFNVPFGDNPRATICNPSVLEAASTALQAAEVLCTGFDSIVDRAAPGDLVYFDPPYVPLSLTSSFAGYAKGGFGPAEQARLASVAAELDRNGVRFILSNSMTESVRTLYREFRIETVMASRSVNSKAGGRGAVEEALVSNH